MMTPSPEHETVLRSPEPGKKRALNKLALCCVLTRVRICSEFKVDNLTK